MSIRSIGAGPAFPINLNLKGSDVTDIVIEKISASLLESIGGKEVWNGITNYNKLCLGNRLYYTDDHRINIRAILSSMSVVDNFSRMKSEEKENYKEGLLAEVFEHSVSTIFKDEDETSLNEIFLTLKSCEAEIKNLFLGTNLEKVRTNGLLITSYLSEIVFKAIIDLNDISQDSSIETLSEESDIDDAEYDTAVESLGSSSEEEYFSSPEGLEIVAPTTNAQYSLTEANLREAMGDSIIPEAVQRTRLAPQVEISLDSHGAVIELKARQKRGTREIIANSNLEIQHFYDALHIEKEKLLLNYERNSQTIVKQKTKALENIETDLNRKIQALEQTVQLHQNNIEQVKPDLVKLNDRETYPKIARYGQPYLLALLARYPLTPEEQKAIGKDHEFARTVLINKIETKIAELGSLIDQENRAIANLREENDVLRAEISSRAEALLAQNYQGYDGALNALDHSENRRKTIERKRDHQINALEIFIANQIQLFREAQTQLMLRV